MTNYRGVTVAVVIAAGVTAAARLPAQTLAVFGSAGADGLGQGSALMGGALSRDRQGWSPVLTVEGYAFRYHDAPDHLTTAGAFAPSIGAKYQQSKGDIEGDVGYAFISAHSSIPVVNVGTGTENSMFVGAQANYWGSGSTDGQLIGSYSIKSHYIWSRARLLQRPGSVPFLLGGDLTVQGGGVGSSVYQYEVGPAIEFRAMNDIHLEVAGGLRTTSGATPNVATGYARVDLLFLTKF